MGTMIFDDSFEIFDLGLDRRAFGQVYYLIYKGIIVYIGQSVNLPSRINSHKVDKIFDTVRYKEFPIDVLSKEEMKAIVEHKPIYNKGGITKQMLETLPPYIEFDDYYIFRSVGTLVKSKCMIKNRILLYVIKGCNINDITILRIEMATGHYTSKLGYNKKYCPLTHDYIDIPVEKPTHIVFTNYKKKKPNTSKKLTQSTKLNFGKYKDQSIWDILNKDKQYITWLLTIWEGTVCPKVKERLK